MRCERGGRLSAFVLTGGERHERTAFAPLMAAAVKRAGPGRSRRRPDALLADRSYAGRPIRDHLRRCGISAIIPQLRTETRVHLMDWCTYRERDTVERLVGRLKEHRRLATRYDKLATSYLALVHLAAILLPRSGPIPTDAGEVCNRAG